MRTKKPTIFAIGDLHLPVDVQVSKYSCPPDYFDQIFHHLLINNPEVLLVAGDLVWGDNVANVKEELNRIQSLPSKLKFFIEGNHDEWMDRLGNSYQEAQQQMYERFSNPSFYYIGGRASIITLTLNNITDLNKQKKKHIIKIGICGARGFAFDPQKPPTDDDLILRNAELESLDRALANLQLLLETNQTILNMCLLHYPPTTRVFSNERIADEEFLTHIQNSHIINKVIFGHVHIDNYLQLYTKIDSLELYCTTMDRNNYNSVKLFDANS